MKNFILGPLSGSRPGTSEDGSLDLQRSVAGHTDILKRALIRAGRSFEGVLFLASNYFSKLQSTKKKNVRKSGRSKL